MQTTTITRIFFLGCVQAVFLAAIIALHIFCTLPHARLEGIDCIALPGENLALQCFVAVAPPGPRPVRGEGVLIAFSALRVPAGAVAPERASLGSVVADARGIATLAWKAPAAIGVVTEIVPEIQGEGEIVLQPVKPRPYIFVTTQSEGAVLILCDVEALLEERTTWDELQNLPPADWPFDVAAAAALDAATQGRTRQIVYLAPGTKFLTTEVRAALNARHFPRGPVLFPDATPGADSTALAVNELLRKWPYTKCAIFRRAALAAAVAAKNLPAVAVGRAPAGVLALPKVRTASAWSELSTLLDSL